MTQRKERRKQNSRERGITLIALVITIIVLRILAGVALAALTGDSGILNNADNAKIETNHKTVAECLKLKMGEYQIEKSANGYTKDFITFLEENTDGEIVDDNGVINVKNLVGKKLGNGNGDNLNDVYVLEEVSENSYTLRYNINETTSIELGTLGDTPTAPPTPTDSKYFAFSNWNSTARTVTFNGIHPDYCPQITYTNEIYHEMVSNKFPAYIKVDETTKITNIVIPETVVREEDGLTYTVTAIKEEAFRIFI